MQTLTFATNNQHKMLEAQEIFSKAQKNIEILSLADNNIDIDIPEPYHTFEENSQHKAETIYNQYHINCFAEDAGLIVDSLNGEPGVLSARYAGDHDSAKNIQKVLEKLDTKNTDRTAKFVAVITLIIDGKVQQFRGECLGTIAENRDGTLSFGYDPIFIPEGYDKTSAELGDGVKSKVSHRKKALQQMIEYMGK